MNSTRRIILLLLVMLASSFLPAVAAAQSSTETVTIQVNGTTPAGTSVIGTIVVERNCGATVSSNLMFNGMINGKQAQFSGKVRENWLGNGAEEVEIVSTDLAGLVLGKSPLRTIAIAQTTANAITVDGIPAAIDGTFQAPCSGRTAYTITNAGQGTQTISQLPNTASQTGFDAAKQLLFQPYAIAGLCIAAGTLLLLASRILRDPRMARL